MKILNPASLIGTVDAFNEAVFSGLSWREEAEAIVDWIGTRLGEWRGYAGSFALTTDDWAAGFRLFTGEPVTTRAARTHIIAEEATRVLVWIRNETGMASEALAVSEERLGERIFGEGRYSISQGGVYCCGKCSLALWRNIAAGAFAARADVLKPALETLAAERDGAGGWRRFPFYYTLLFLSGLPLEAARPELEYCAPRARRARRLLDRQKDAFSRRRLQLIDRLPG